MVPARIPANTVTPKEMIVMCLSPPSVPDWLDGSRDNDTILAYKQRKANIPPLNADPSDSVYYNSPTEKSPALDFFQRIRR